MAKSPVYFISHGGPNIIYETTHPAYSKLQEIGMEITTRVKPKAMVVFSAHWQAERDAVEVNVGDKGDLIYDFYGFPSQYYKETYPNTGSKSLAAQILSLLHSKDIPAKPVSRGLDHGIWFPFKVLFDPDHNPLNVPIVQVSLLESEDPYAHYTLGRAIESLRSQGILTLVSGMAVHSLRDLGRMMRDPTPMPYTVSFDQALKDAVEGKAEGREQRMVGLLKRGDMRQAHPTIEHLLPIYVGAGAAGMDQGKRVWTMLEGCMGWGMYRFGEIEGS